MQHLLFGPQLAVSGGLRVYAHACINEGSDCEYVILTTNLFAVLHLFRRVLEAKRPYQTICVTMFYAGVSSRPHPQRTHARTHTHSSAGGD